MASLAPLIEAYTPRNGIVLDPFAGSGSTGVAALQSRRRCLLIEKDAAHYETIRLRIEKLPHHWTTSAPCPVSAGRKRLFAHLATLTSN